MNSAMQDWSPNEIRNAFKVKPLNEVKDVANRMRDKFDGYLKSKSGSVSHAKASELEEYRKAKFPTLDEARQKIEGNWLSETSPKNYLDHTSNNEVKFSSLSKVYDETGKVTRLNTVGQIIERNSQFHNSATSRDEIAEQNVHSAVYMAAQELSRTQKREGKDFEGGYNDLKVLQAKHQVEQKFFDVRYTESVELKIPYKQENELSQAYTDYSRLSNAKLIESVEQKYPQETKAISKGDYSVIEASRANTTNEPVKSTSVSMKPNQNGFTPIDQVRERLAKYAQRREQKMAVETTKPAAKETESAATKQFNEMLNTMGARTAAQKEMKSKKAITI